MQEKVRTGAIAVRKIRGEVNPADLFTKHFPSKDKIHQLTSLFGCECRSGRAESAPLLRPHKRDGQKVGRLPVEGLLPHFNIDLDEIHMHDESVLPHLHDYEYALRMFPRIGAAPPQPNLTDWVPRSVEGWNTSGVR